MLKHPHFINLWPILIFFYTANLASAQILPSSNAPTRFETITSKEGLPHKGVFALCQDHLGFIWVGTPIGLARYDGYEFTSYPYYHTDSTGQTSEVPLHVTVIAEDPWGDLWLGCQHQSPDLPILLKFDRETETLIPCLFLEKPSYSLIDNILFTEDWMWIARPLTRLHLSEIASDKWDPDSLNFEFLPKGTKGLTRNLAPGLTVDSKDALWLPTEKGTFQWLPDQDTFLFHQIDLFPKEINHKEWYFFTHIIEGSTSGWYWALSNRPGNIIRFNPVTGEQKIVRDKNFTAAVRIAIKSNPGQIWLGIKVGQGGVAVFDIPTETINWIQPELEDRDFFPLLRVENMLQDFTGNIWIGSSHGPLLKFEPQKNRFKHLQFQPYATNALTHNFTSGIDQDQSGIYWISTLQRGLNRWDKKNNRISKFTLPVDRFANAQMPITMDLEVATDGKVWFTSGFSVGSFDPGSKEYFFQNLRGSVHSIFEDSKKRLWATSFGSGLFLLDPNTNRFEQVPIPNPINPGQRFGITVQGIMEDSRGDFWLGTFAPTLGGFHRYHPDKNEIEPFNLPQAQAFCEDQQGFIWIASVKGLFRFDPNTETFKEFNIKDGLPNASVNSIEEDDHGRLWLGTDNGLSCFDPKTTTFRNYFESDGLLNNEFLSKSYKNEQGELFFLSYAGVLYFHPDSLRENTIPPKVAFTGIDISGEPLSLDPAGPLKQSISTSQEIHFSHFQNNLTIHYAALHYKNPSGNRYKYRLEPYEPDWQPEGSRRFANYTNLDPGRYTFRVIAANSDGHWNEEGIALHIIIHPPWYWNTWSQLFYLLSLGGGIILLYRFQLNRSLALAEAERLREIDEVKTKLYTNITHEFRTPLTVIQGITEQIDHYEKETELIQRNSQQLLELINRMLELAKLDAGKLEPQLLQGDIISFLRYITESFHSLALNQKINLTFYASDTELKMDYDPEKTLQILSNLVSNAIKFTPEYGKILVTALREKRAAQQGLLVQVKDTGIGIEEDHLNTIFDRFSQVDSSSTRKNEGTGIGLALTKELVELLGGAITVSSRIREGSTFSVFLPITNKAPFLSEDQSVNSQKLPAAGLVSLPFEPENQDTASIPEESRLVLIVEDNLDVMQYLTACLKDDYQLLYARNGREGIDQALQYVPDLVISDVMMPEVDGFELCQILKQDERTSHIPIVLLTAKGDLESKLEGLEYGADAYLTKPFHRKELHIRLRKLIDLRRKLQARYQQPDFQPSTATAREDAFIIKVRCIIMNHLEEDDFGIEDLCREVHLSRIHLHRKLKALSGKSASHFIRQVRLQEAHQLLQTSDLSIAEVAFQVGFSDPAYFSRLFSEAYGKPPSAIRSNG